MLRLFRSKSAQKPGVTSEPRQPVPTVTRADVERILERDFDARDHGEALRLLTKYDAERWDDRGASRVRLAALKLSTGDPNKLRSLLERARHDYRDILAAAEYPSYMKCVAGATTPENERKKAIDADWHQYQEWLQR